MNEIIRALSELARFMADHPGVQKFESRKWDHLALACEQYVAERAPVSEGGAK